MPELIKPNDLPALRNEDRTLCEIPEMPPGTTYLRHMRNQGTEWFCKSCDGFVSPIFIRVGEVVFPACLECFYNEMPETKTEVQSAMEVLDVETAAKVDVSDAPAEVGAVAEVHSA